MLPGLFYTTHSLNCKMTKLELKWHSCKLFTCSKRTMSRAAHEWDKWFVNEQSVRDFWGITSRYSLWDASSVRSSTLMSLGRKFRRIVWQLIYMSAARLCLGNLNRAGSAALTTGQIYRKFHKTGKGDSYARTAFTRNEYLLDGN